MKLFNLLLFLFFSAFIFAQDDLDDESMDSEDGVESVETTEGSSELKDKKLEFDDFKYTGTDKVKDVKVWYNLYASRRFKKWRKTKDAALAADVKKYFWQIIAVDPNGEIKNPKGRPYLGYSYEKLAEVYLSENNQEILEVVLARGLKFKPKSTKLNRYAGMMFASLQQKEAAISHFEKVIKYSRLKTEKDKNFVISMYKLVISLYDDLGDKDNLIASCDKALAIRFDADIEKIKINAIGDYSELKELYLNKLKENPQDYDTMRKLAMSAAREEDDEIAIKYLKVLVKNDPKNINQKKTLVKVLYRNEDFSGVIAYGKSISDRNVRKMVIRSYGEKGQFKEAFNLASTVQRSDRKQGHYLKGQVYEAVALAAKEEYAKKPYEWRLLYRLAYIEYELAGDSRKNQVRGLIPTKGDIFLKNKRVKANAGKYSNWITWQKEYDKEVFSPDN